MTESKKKNKVGENACHIEDRLFYLKISLESVFFRLQLPLVPLRPISQR